MKLDKEDLDAIADAVATKLATIANISAPKGTKATTKGKAEEKPADKPADGPKREDVFAFLKEVGEKAGRDKVVATINKYAPKFSEVKDSDLGNLKADLDALASGDGEGEDEF